MSSLPSLDVMPATNRQPLHPSITHEQIENMVETFYSRVQKHARLGPLFDKHISKDWAYHLAIMKKFWSSVLLKTGTYKGKPVPVHQKIEGLETADFENWLELFAQTIDEIFEPSVRPLIMETAKRIATSLWLSRSTDPFQSPPQWA